MSDGGNELSIAAREPLSFASQSSNNDLDHPILNLNPEEKRFYGQLFSQADTDRLGVITGENAVKFFEKSRIAPNVLGEVRPNDLHG